MPPIHKRVRRDGNSISVIKKEGGSRGDKAGSVRVPHKGAIASRRARDLIRSLADGYESALRAIQSTDNLGKASDTPHVVVDDLQN